MIKELLYRLCTVAMPFSLIVLLATSTPLLAQSSANRIFQCSDCFVILKVRKCVAAQYPLLGKSIRLEGYVVVEIVVDADGTVISAIATSGPALLRASSVGAALKWKFEPRIINSKASTVRGVIIFEFRLLAQREPLRACGV